MYLYNLNDIYTPMKVTLTLATEQTESRNQFLRSYNSTLSNLRIKSIQTGKYSSKYQPGVFVARLLKGVDNKGGTEGI